VQTLCSLFLYSAQSTRVSTAAPPSSAISPDFSTLDSSTVESPSGPAQVSQQVGVSASAFFPLWLLCFSMVVVFSVGRYFITHYLFAPFVQDSSLFITHYLFAPFVQDSSLLTDSIDWFAFISLASS